MNIKDVLRAGIPQRQEEIDMYDLNITNFAMAVELIDSTQWDDPQLSAAMQDYKAHLLELKQQNIVEREKTKIILDVIIARIKE